MIVPVEKFKVTVIQFSGTGHDHDGVNPNIEVATKSAQIIDKSQLGPSPLDYVIRGWGRIAP